MSKAIGLAILVVGIVLIAYGAHASDSISSGMSRMFTGGSTDRTIWFFVGGIIASIWGGAMVFLPFPKN